jgi:hypothetical protein
LDSDEVKGLDKRWTSGPGEHRDDPPLLVLFLRKASWEKLDVEWLRFGPVNHNFILNPLDTRTISLLHD